MTVTNTRLSQQDPAPVEGRPATLFILVGGIAFLSGGALLYRGSSDATDVYEKARRLDSVVTLISDLYVDSLNGAQLYDLATDGMLRALGDPYTAFLDPDDLENLRVGTRGNYIGLGIRIEVSDGWITIVTPIADSPAEDAGINSGDRIVEVAGESTRGWSSEKAVVALRGDSGTTIELGVARPGVPEVMRFSLERTRIHVTSVRHTQLLGDDIGYVELETVSEQSAREVADAVARLREDGARKLVLDLRFNPGGLLSEGIAVADLFLTSGDAIVETRGRVRATSRTYEAQTAEEWSGMPVVVLVNEFSASAAEIIAGALQDHDRALVLGTATFGKGVVQRVFHVSRTEALRLTTSRWYTPSGRSIHREQRNSSRSRRSRADSTEVTRQDSTTFRSDAGRVLRGGGGIRPDVVVEASAQSDAVRRLQRVLGADIQTLQDVLASYALEIKAEDTIAGPSDIAVTPRMRRDLLRRLRERSVAVPLDAWDGASDFVERQLRLRVLRYVFGREAEMRDQIAADVVVSAAVDLLGRSQTQQELFAAAVGR